jgi:hypothetical protein
MANRLAHGQRFLICRISVWRISIWRMGEFVAPFLTLRMLQVSAYRADCGRLCDWLATLRGFRGSSGNLLFDIGSYLLQDACVTAVVD